MNDVNKMIYLKVLLSMGAFFTAVKAEVKLPAVFNHHMVLQQQKAVPIWGQARAGEAITLHFKEQIVKTVANDNGAWQVTLNPMAATHEGDRLTVTGDNEIQLTDVVVGEVWLCSGQSNMHWKVAATGLYETEIAESKQYPLIRLFSVPYPISKRRTWHIATPATVNTFSAVGYFFGLALYKTLKVPIGLIHASVGGTQIESWMRIDTLLKLKIPAITTRINSELAIKARLDQHQEMALQDELLKWKQAVRTARAQGEKPPPRAKTLWHPEQSPWMAGNLYQQMIKPIIPYAIRGVIWYQGESNAKNAKQYQKLFPALIRSWRQAWQADEFPFLYVQLANFLAEQTQPVEGGSWPFLREAQLMTLSVPNTAMISAIDLG
ncbi:MAG: sialate O-acetylesterase, partial [Pseudomonadota bacterium]|nr:sialate O-acetylesterase [Pseudomonadota bacterium]